ncbi:MAG: aminotransferase class V-fold PLP-dependent enzyme [Alphaproteobacteria bacterium]|jgi:cysteine desulfurase/selenocysteine lyase|tara:strand:- start:545 stop:1756 length:1212 start_codon:yes stop_codon:yes gene_type:complete
MSNIFKADFPILQKRIRNNVITYLDTASSSQKPTAVIDSISNFYLNSYENVHRGMNSLSIDATEIYESTREKVRSFINAKSTNEIIFTKNATEGTNIIANALFSFLEDGDEIITTELEHHSNFIPWMSLAKKKNLTFKVVPILPNGTIREEDIINAISESTKLVAISHMSNVTGQMIDVKKIKASVKKDILFFIDGCQSIAHRSVDVQDLDCDFFVFSSHKLYGPSGVGVLYGKEGLLNSLPTVIFGGGMINQVELDSFTPAILPNKFEAGTPPIEATAGLSAALDYLVENKFENYFDEEIKLRESLINELKNLGNIDIYGVSDDIHASSIVSFNVQGKNYNDIATFLDQYGVMIRSGHHCCQPFMKKLKIPGTCRVSFGIYNSQEDISLFIDALNKTNKLLS